MFDIRTILCCIGGFIFKFILIKWQYPHHQDNDAIHTNTVDKGSTSTDNMRMLFMSD